MRACAFSKMRGRRAHEGRLHHGEVLDDLVHAAVDGGGEAAGELGREQHLAERVRHRQPQELHVGLVEDLLRPGWRLPRRSRRSAAAGRPWACRWSPRCRSAWRGGRARPRRSPGRRRSGLSARCFSPRAARSSRVITQSPSPSAGPSTDRQHHLVEVRAARSCARGAWRPGSRPRRRRRGTRSRRGCRRRPRRASRDRRWWWPPPAHMTARSAKIHSTRVPEAIPTRCSGSMPRASSPAAILSTLLPGLLPGDRGPGLPSAVG